MKLRNSIPLILMVAAVSNVAHSQNSVEKIEADIAAKKAENAEQEAKNPPMEIELNRQPTETETAITDLATMRKLLNQLKLVNREVDELSDSKAINDVLLDTSLSVDDRLARAMDIASTQRELEAKRLRIEEQRRAKAQATTPTPSPVVNEKPAARSTKPTQSTLVVKAPAKPVAKVEPISVSFVHVYADGSPTKVGFRQGVKLGAIGIVGGPVSEKLNGKQYVVDSVEQIGDSQRYKGRPVYRVVVKDVRGKPTSFNFE